MGKEGEKQVLQSELAGGLMFLRVLSDLPELFVPSREDCPGMGTLTDGMTQGPDTAPFIC